jgi:hypothetical protein
MVVNACVLNRSHEHWLFFYALHVTITMALKLKEEFEMPPILANLMDDDMALALELSTLASDVRKQVCNVLDFFLSFLMKYGKRTPITTCYP